MSQGWWSTGVDLPLTISSLRMSNLSTKSTLICMILPRYNVQWYYAVLARVVEDIAAVSLRVCA